MVGAYLTVESGADDIVLSGNNITTSGGAIAVAGAAQVRLENNQCEFPGYLKGANWTPYSASAFASNKALIYLSGVKFLEAYGNNFNTGGDLFAGYQNFGATAHGTATIDGMTIVAGQIFAGQQIAGYGIPAGARVVSVAGVGGGAGAGSIVMSLAATLPSGNFPNGVFISNPNQAATGPVNNVFTITGTLTSTTNNITALSTTTGLQVGMSLAGAGLPLDAVIATINTGASSLTYTGTAASASGATTISVGVSPQYAVRVVDGSSNGTIHNLFEANSFYLGTVAHIRVESTTASYPAITVGAGNAFLGAVPCPLVTPPFPVSEFPFTNNSNTGNIRYQGFGASGSYTPSTSNLSGCTLSGVGASV
jgi:hypothetical protein